MVPDEGRVMSECIRLIYIYVLILKGLRTVRPPLATTLTSSYEATTTSLDYNYYYGLDYELSYDGEAFENYTQVHNTDLPPLGNLQYLRKVECSKSISFTNQTT